MGFRKSEIPVVESLPPVIVPDKVRTLYECEACGAVRTLPTKCHTCGTADRLSPLAVKVP